MTYYPDQFHWNLNIEAMKSTSLMHDLIEEYGEGHDKVRMMRDLRVLKSQIRIEMRKKLYMVLRNAQIELKEINI